MKRSFAVSIVVVLLISMVFGGCAGKEAVPTPTEQNPVQTETPKAAQPTETVAAPTSAPTEQTPQLNDSEALVKVDDIIFKKPGEVSKILGEPYQTEKCKWTIVSSGKTVDAVKAYYDKLDDYYGRIEVMYILDGAVRIHVNLKKDEFNDEYPSLVDNLKYIGLTGSDYFPGGTVSDKRFFMEGRGDISGIEINRFNGDYCSVVAYADLGR